MGIGVLDQRALPAIGGPNVVRQYFRRSGSQFRPWCHSSFVGEPELCRSPLRPKGRCLLSAYAARAEGKGFNVVCCKLLVYSELMSPVGGIGIHFGNGVTDGGKLGMTFQANFAVGG